MYEFVIGAFAMPFCQFRESAIIIGESGQMGVELHKFNVQVSTQ